MKPGKVGAFSFCTTISLTGNTALETCFKRAVKVNSSRASTATKWSSYHYNVYFESCQCGEFTDAWVVGANKLQVDSKLWSPKQEKQKGSRHIKNNILLQMKWIHHLKIDQLRFLPLKQVSAQRKMSNFSNLGVSREDTLKLSRSKCSCPLND